MLRRYVFRWREKCLRKWLRLRLQRDRGRSWQFGRWVSRRPSRKWMKRRRYVRRVCGVSWRNDIRRIALTFRTVYCTEMRHLKKALQLMLCKSKRLCGPYQKRNQDSRMRCSSKFRALSSRCLGGIQEARISRWVFRGRRSWTSPEQHCPNFCATIYWEERNMNWWLSSTIQQHFHLHSSCLNKVKSYMRLWGTGVPKSIR